MRRGGLSYGEIASEAGVTARTVLRELTRAYAKPLPAANDIAFSIERCNLLPPPRSFRRIQRGVLMFNAEAASIGTDPS